MNKLIKILFIIIFSTTKISSQVKTGKIFYKKIQKNGVEQKENDCILYFDKNHTYFLSKRDKAITKVFIDNDGSVITPSNTIDSIANKPLFVYFKRKENKFFTNDINLNQETLIYIDQDKGEWALSNETKKIGKYNCFRATKNSKGTNYIAWYTTEIPFPYGPIAINGLKGIILELYTEDKSIHFKFEKYEKTNESINDFIKSYNFDKAISFEEYLKLKKKRANEFKEKAMLNAPVGARVIENYKKCEDCN